MLSSKILPIKYLPSALIIFIFFAPCFLFAQKLSFGIKGGMNVSGATGTAYESFLKKGLSLYGFADIDISKNFSIIAEEGYVQKGFKSKSYDFYSDDEHYFGQLIAKLDYIDFAILAKGKLIIGKTIPYLFAGPFVGIKVLGKVEATGNSYNTGDLFSLVDAINSNSYGIKAGAGVEIAMKGVGFIFEVRSSFDMFPIHYPPDLRLGIETWYYSEDLKSYSFEFMTGVKF